MIAAEELAIELDQRLEPDWQRRREFLALSPEGRVPVLINQAHAVLSGAVPILEYWLEDHDARADLFGATAETRAESRRLLQWFLVKFEEEVARLLVEEKILKRLVKGSTPDTPVLRAGQHNLRIHLRYLDYLAERRHYLAGDRFGLADIAAAAALSLTDYLGDVPWSDHPGAKDWYMRVKSRRSVRHLLSQRLPGLAPPAHYARPDF